MEQGSAQLGDYIAAFKVDGTISLSRSRAGTGGHYRARELYVHVSARFLTFDHHRPDCWQKCTRYLPLQDWSLAGYCPWVVSDLHIPKYFAPDALQLISEMDTKISREGSGVDADDRLDYRDDWPSLFIGEWSQV